LLRKIKHRATRHPRGARPPAHRRPGGLSAEPALKRALGRVANRLNAPRKRIAATVWAAFPARFQPECDRAHL